MNVRDQLLDPVIMDPRRHIRSAVTTLVRRDCTEPGCRESGQLVAPRKRQFRKSVQQHDGMALALFIDGHADPVGLDECRLGKRGGGIFHDSLLLAQSMQSRAVGSASRRRGSMGSPQRSQSP